MEKYKVKIYTTCPDLIPECIMDEFMLGDFLKLDSQQFIRIDDDTEESFFILNISQIVGIEWQETQNQ